MLKKLFLAAIVTLSICSISAFAFTDVKENEDNVILNVLGAMDVIKGFEDGSFKPNDNLTRAQFSKIAVVTKGLAAQVEKQDDKSTFKDLNNKHWAFKYIKVASANGIMTGINKDSFSSDGTMTVAQAATVAVRLLGYKDADLKGKWPENYMQKGKELGVLEGVPANSDKLITRMETAKLMYNTIFALVKQGDKKFIETIGYSFVKDAILLIANGVDSSLAKDDVRFSTGVVKTLVDISISDMGKKGNILKNNANNKIIGFYPYEQQTNDYTFISINYLKLDVFKAETMITIGLADDATTYFRGSKIAFKDAKPKLISGSGLKVCFTETGVVDYIYVNDSLSIETVVKGDWLDKLGIKDKEKLQIYNNGIKLSIEDVEAYNVASYNPVNNMLWIYDNKDIGVFEKAIPNKEKITKALISGITYDVLPEAVEKFSKGSYNIGDGVVVLLNKSGKIIDIISDKEYEQPFYGFVISSRTVQLTDPENFGKSVIMVKLITKNGFTRELVTDVNYNSIKGNLVKYKFQNGNAVLEALNTGSNLSGIVDVKKLLIGTSPISGGIKTMELFSNNMGQAAVANTVKLIRLEGIKLSSNNVVFADKDKNGKINFLFIKNVTNDSYEYGIVTKSTINSDRTSASYEVDMRGKKVNLSSSVIFPVDANTPVLVDYSNNRVNGLVSLMLLSSSNVSFNSDLEVEFNGSKYYIAPNAVVYLKQLNSEGKYDYLTILLRDLISNQNSYFMNFYADKSQESGGRIRLIIVTKNK